MYRCEGGSVVVLVVTCWSVAAVVTAARDGLQTSVGELEAIRDDDRLAQCATSPPSISLTTRSKIDCMRACISHGCSCAYGANYHRDNKTCQLHSEPPHSFQHRPTCVYYERKDDRDHAVAALKDSCTPLLIQQNIDGSPYMSRSWETFKLGFGLKTCNYWLGNEQLHELTKAGLYKLRVDVQALDSGQWYWAEYSTFIVGSEATKYKLTVGGYSGNAGDAMSYHNGVKFTTFDNDNDGSLHGNCAVFRGGGFWYKGCAKAHLNSATGYGGHFDGPGWYDLPRSNGKLKTSRAWLACR